MHPDARERGARARFTPALSAPIVGDNLRYLVKMPRRFLAALAMLIFPGACAAATRKAPTGQRVPRWTPNGTSAEQSA